jgi:hypothetical protein
MADDLDRFVLQYTVELKDSIARLSSLQDKMNKVDKVSSSSAKGLKKFASGAASELDRLTPGVSALANAVKGMGAEFALAGAAVGILGVGIKAAIDLRQQFNAQATAGLQIGVSGLRMEDLTRQMIKNGNGRVDRASAGDALSKISSTFSEGFTDLTGVKRAQLKRLLGVDLGSFDKPTGYVDRLTQTSSFLNGQSDAQVAATAKNLGIDPQALLSLAHAGSSIGKVSMSDSDAKMYSDASDSLQKFNGNLATFTEKMNELEMAFAGPLLPGLTRFVELMTKLSSVVPATMTATGDRTTGLVQGLTGVDLQSGKLNKGLFGVLSGEDFKPDDRKPWYRKGVLGLLTDAFMGPSDKIQSRQDGGGSNGENARDELRTVDNFTEGLDASNKASAALTDQQTILMNMFSSAVSTFSQAVDMHQAWAAWAGNIGQANGIKGASGSSGPSNMTLGGGGSGNWKNSQYSGQIQAAAQAYGLDPQMLYAIMMTESHGVNGKYSETGAGGLMQVTKGNWRAYGGSANVMDTGANIMVGARIYAESLKRAGGDVNKGLGYYNGNSDPNYQAKVAGNYGGSSAGIGQSRSTLMLTQVQNAVAGSLGIPVRQLQQGRAGRGDVQYTIDNLEAGYLNGANQAQMRLQNPIGLSQIQIADFKNQLLVAQRGLAAMETYKKQIIDGANGNGTLTAQRIGGTMAPISMTANFNINGNVDAKTLAKEIDDRLQHHMQNAVNSVTNQEKG